MQCFLSVILMLLRICARCGIDFLQLTDRKRRFLRVLSLKLLVKIRQLRFSLLKLCDDQSHLISPVAQMDIADHLVSFKPGDPLHAFSDDR